MLANICSLAFPGLIYCSSYGYDKNTVSASMGYSSIEKNITAEAKPAASETRDNFYPILITSFVVLGVLIFAMWQTFKSKRHS